MRKFLIKAFKNDFVQGGFILTLSNFITGFLNYISNFLTGRALGPSLYGDVTALFAYSFILSVPITVLSTLVIQKISSRGKNHMLYALSLESFFVKKLKKLWLFIIFLLILTPFIPKITNLSTLTSYSLIPLSLLTFFAAFYNASFLGLRMFMLFSIISIAASAIRLIGTFIAFLGIGGIYTVIFSSIASSIFFLLASYILFHRKIGNRKHTISINIDRRLLHIIFDHQVMLYFLSTLAFAAFNNFDIIFVKKFFSQNETGIYSSWSLFAKMIVYALTPLSSVSFVFFSSRLKRGLQQTTLLATLILLPIAGIAGYFFYLLLGPQIVLFLYGKKFLPVIPFLGQASIFGFLFVAIMFINGYFMAKKSRLVLIFVICLPLYLIGFFLLAKKLEYLIQYVVYFSAFATFLYVVAYLKSLFKVK